MTVDPLSPIAPARIRALLVPVGRIKRSRFLALAQRLQDYNVVRLGDVSPDGRSQTFMTRNAFSPLAFPTGMIIYNLDISLPPLAHIDTFPFEPFREPFAIIAIADGTELSKPAEQEDEVLPNGHSSEDHPRPEEFEQLQEELNYLKAEYERSLIQHLFVFDYHGVDNLIFGPDRTIWIPPPEACRSTTIKTAMCDLTSSLLWEMNKFAEFISDIPMIDSPKITFAETEDVDSATYPAHEYTSTRE
ncbi:hypothetical protein KEM55_003498 [Ascosphaera atra]|nr:hypothetical protein KEM55_003498 [Ascosphaera atra]